MCMLGIGAKGRGAVLLSMQLVIYIILSLRFAVQIYKAQRNVILCVSACLLYWCVYRICKYYKEIQSLEAVEKRTLEDGPVRNPEEKWQMEAKATRLLQIQFRCYNVRR
ncbi:hypothetical protein POTOM_050202 [Populus tomentosa]|uniref:Endoplasmic reticulum transmembrane protein n=1 Tax=Populus tomentosa TaxID=118781 RepID=A0A8X8C7T6_POPTO|nr:hypothetical protein POTOM_050202 [Populus tomentosa]